MALKARLEIVNPFELSTIEYQYDWKKRHLNSNNSNNLFHPVKDIYKQYRFRRYIRKNLLVTE